MEQEGGDGKEAASLQCTGKWKTKSITSRGKVKAGWNACPVVCSFPHKKASHMSVRPFLRSVNLCIQNAVGQGS